MGKLLHIFEDGTTTELTIGEGLAVEDKTLKIVNPCVIQSLLNTFKLNEMLIFEGGNNMSNYEKQNFTSGQVLKAEHLNHIEDGITSVLPPVEGNGKCLVINQNGEVAWDTRYGFSYFVDDYLCPENSSDGTFIIYGACFVQNPIVGETYDVICNGVVYPAECKMMEGGTSGSSLYFGNLSILNEGPDTGEPFVILGAAVNIATLGFITDSIKQEKNTLAVRGKKEIITKIPGQYIAGGVYPGEGKDSCAFNGVLPQEVTGTHSCAMNSGRASGTLSFAANASTANGHYSTSIGRQCYSNGSNSFSGGFGTYANGSQSFAHGMTLKASSDNQFVTGKYNIEDSNNKYLHIVGNGYFDQDLEEKIYSNAYTLDWSGNGWFAGDVEGNSMIVKSSTEGSNKRFKITVDDSGAISATEIVE